MSKQNKTKANMYTEKRSMVTSGDEGRRWAK